MISLMPVTPISCRRVSSFMSPRRCKSTSYISSIVRINVSPRFWRSSPVRSRARYPVIPGSSCRTGGALRLDIAKLLRRSVASFHYICLSHRSRSTPPLPFSQSREATRSILALRERTRCRIPSCLCGWPGGDSPRTSWSQPVPAHVQEPAAPLLRSVHGSDLVADDGRTFGQIARFRLGHLSAPRNSVSTFPECASIGLDSATAK